MFSISYIPTLLASLPMPDTDTASSFDRFLQLLRLDHPFAMWSVVASLIIGVICGLVGTFLVLRGMSLIGDAVGHSTLPGVAAGFLILSYQASWAMLLGATITGVIAAWCVSAFNSGQRTRSDGAIAIVIAGGFGIGAILFTIAQASPTGAQAGLNTVFFGNVAAITPKDVGIIGVASVALAAILILFWRPISLSIFDRVFAHAIGIPVKRIDTLLLVMLAVCVVVAVQAVGVVLVASMLIIPPTAARMLTDSLPKMAAISSICGAFCGIAGAVVSYLYEGVATGPAMVLFACGSFLVAVVYRALFVQTAQISPTPISNTKISKSPKLQHPSDPQEASHALASSILE